eukprot:NODE_4098_length_609_cov_223.758929_g2939_i0.p4 GENE.NODE_4098_length_609_cov_223.758929_g2939_i0~~NODE_4098_length_609_cov_223.758929_g2939_i0.p4  ORF type:complete len:69 (-),score=4.25 NODE_4098_length_609_cov_223.758929_g2939_i0:110-316(-)
MCLLPRAKADLFAHRPVTRQAGVPSEGRLPATVLARLTPCLFFSRLVVLGFPWGFLSPLVCFSQHAIL